MGISQAACGIYQTAAKAMVTQHWPSLNRVAFWRSLVVIRNVRNAGMLEASHKGEYRRERHDVWERLSGDILVSYGVLLRPKLCVTPSPGSRINHLVEMNRRATPGSTAHLTENTIRCHIPPDANGW